MVPSGTAQFASNPWGLYDMHGNVSEWTRSTYQPYPYSDTDGRNDPAADARKVVRGGSWRDKPKFATSSYRLMYPPSRGYSTSASAWLSSSIPRLNSMRRSPAGRPHRESGFGRQ